MYNIYHDVIIQAPAKQIFDAVSTAEGLANWWTLKSDGQAQIGAAYQFYFAPEYDWRAKVTALISPRFIEYTLVHADADWTGTVLGFMINSEEDSCTLSFSHEGWATNNAHFRRTSYCWAQYLRCLKDFIEQGEVLPYPERGGT